MARALRHPGFSSSELVRLLADLAGADGAMAEPAYAEQLSRWIHWTDTLALSAALAAPLPAPTAPSAPHPGAPAADAVAQARAEFDRVRAALTRDLAADGDLLGPPGRATPAPEFADFRRHYLARQRAMAQGIAPLRQRLRSALTRRSPALARLAAIDTALETALAPREHALLGAIPSLLDGRYRRLRRAHESAAQAGAPDWPRRFHDDVQRVLRAELDLRLQPAAGLLAALAQDAPTSIAP